MKVEFCRGQDGDGVAVRGADPRAACPCCDLAVSMLCTCTVWIGKSPGEVLSPKETGRSMKKGWKKEPGQPKGSTLGGASLGA